MKKSRKILLGVASFLPLAYMILFQVLIITMVAGVEHSAQHGGPPPAPFFAIFAVHIIVILFTFGLSIYYIINLFNNEAIPPANKALWAVVLLLGNMLAFPFYWYFHIWKEPVRVAVKDAEEDFPGGKVFCRKCGLQNEFNNYKCTGCGELLHYPGTPGPAKDSYGSVGVVIPYKNMPAITAYYMGVFSIPPGFGLLLGIPAFILGIKGRRLAIEHPEKKGIVHAWAGIILGGFFGLCNILALAYIISLGIKF